MRVINSFMRSVGPPINSLVFFFFYSFDGRGLTPSHTTKGSEGCISGDGTSTLVVVQISHKSVGPVAVLTDW